MSPQAEVYKTMKWCKLLHKSTATRKKQFVWYCTLFSMMSQLIFYNKGVWGSSENIDVLWRFIYIGQHCLSVQTSPGGMNEHTWIRKPWNWIWTNGENNTEINTATPPNACVLLDKIMGRSYWLICGWRKWLCFVLVRGCIEEISYT